MGRKAYDKHRRTIISQIQLITVSIASTRKGDRRSLQVFLEVRVVTDDGGRVIATYTWPHSQPNTQSHQLKSFSYPDDCSTKFRRCVLPDRG